MRKLLLLCLCCCSGISIAHSTMDTKRDKQLECLAKNIYFEARNQSIEGKLAVLFVTINRVNSSRFPNTICGVVWQHKQFSWTHDGKSDRPYEKHKYNQILTFISQILPILDHVKDPTNGALFYHHYSISPCWKPKNYHAQAIDDHIFYTKASKSGSCYK